MTIKTPMQDYRLTGHARLEMERRQISEEEVARVLAMPEQILNYRPGRTVYQSKVDMGEPPKSYLIWVFVDVDRDLPEIVTVYRTSKVEKYWNE